MQSVVVHNRLHKSALLFLIALFALVSAVASPASAQAPINPHSAATATPSVPAESGTFTVSQLGHQVGIAGFRFNRTATGFESSASVKVSMKGLEYALSKTEQLDAAHRVQHVLLSATVNGSAVSVTGKPDSTNFLLNMSANGRRTATRLAAHSASVLLPDFDPGGLQTLLTLALAQNGRDLWAILPKQAGAIEPVQLATYADENGTLNGKPIAVHHLVATIAGAPTDLFSSPDNQLLQAELPQEGFSLIRKSFVLTPPKHPAAPPAQ